MKDEVVLSGFEAEIERRRRDMTETHIAEASKALPPRDSGLAVINSYVGSRVMHLCALFAVSDEECNALAKGPEKSAVWQEKHAFCKAVARRIDLEVRSRFPQLAGKPYVIYSDWSVGVGAKEEIVRPPREPRSTRSGDVRLGSLLHSVP